MATLIDMKSITSLAPAIIVTLFSASVHAHHSYAMFDGSKHRTVQGTIAKVEWGNPHVFVWLYVQRAGGGAYELYGIESDSINELRRRGWAKTSLEPGEVVTVDFFALRDHRNGGHLIKIRRADGTTLSGSPGPIMGIAAGSRAEAAP